MDKRLSILHADEEIDLHDNKSDFIMALSRAFLGVAHKFGPVMVEAFAKVIPNQKLERLTIFAEVLDLKLKHLKEDFVRFKLQTEEGSDLYEDALNQAARAISHERKEYIASLLKNSLTNDDLDHLGKKKLLYILGELNDAEILLLKYYSIISSVEREEFANKHIELFTPISLHMGCSQEDIDKAALRSTYRQRLIDLKLLSAGYKPTKKGEIPEFDDKTGMMKIRGYDVTSLGKLFLRYIDIGDK